VACFSQSGFPFDIGVLAAAYAPQGRKSLARECVEKLTRLAASQYVSPLAEAFAAIGMKDFDLGFQRLNEATEDKTAFVNLLGIEPFFGPLRNDQRFTRLLTRLNLPA
jgi:adenylate cyclase